MKIINEDETAKLINMYCVTNQNTSDQTLLKYQIYDFMKEENIFHMITYYIKIISKFRK